MQHLLRASVVAAIFSCGLLAVVHGQSSSFKSVREWSDQSGKFSIDAKIFSSNSEYVTLVAPKADGSTKKITLPIERLADKDQKLARNFASLKFRQLKKAGDVSALAKDSLLKFQQFTENGFIDDTNRLYVESRIEALEKRAAYDAIMVGDKFLAPDEFTNLRSESGDQVLAWFDAKTATTPGVLRKISSEDPACLSSVVLLAIYYDVHKGDAAAAERVLGDAVKQGKRYAALATEADTFNLNIAINNLAVATARQSRIGKATKLWEEIANSNEAVVKSAVKRNIARVSRMLGREASGLSANTAAKKKILALNAETPSIQPGQASTGWVIICPVDQKLNSLSDVRFLLGDANLQSVADGEIHDTRCVQCDGTDQRNCPNAQCVKGKIKRVRLEKTYDDRGNYTGDRIVEIRYDRCKTCSGDGKIACPFCDKGSQK